MISRRLVRIKTMQTYYAFLQDSGETSSDKIWKELQHNINESYDLYIHLHCLIIAIADFAEDRIEINRNKHITTEKDLNPNTKFIDNKIIQAFRDDSKISIYMNKNQYNWSEHPEFIKKIWEKVSNSEYYKKFMSDPEISVQGDIHIINRIITKSITGSKDLDEILEDKSIYWNDDLEFLLSNIIQQLKKIGTNGAESFFLPALYKDMDDRKFANDLIIKTALHKKEFDKSILVILQKWDLERIAVIDRVILHLALCEITEFPNMPVKVTINEYLDIAKFYSTEKSSIFINGILDKVYTQLKDTNNLNKKGLGLV